MSEETCYHCKTRHRCCGQVCCNCKRPIPNPRGRVVHCNRERYDVYIGRPSKWGNPYVMKRESDRAEVIAQYRADLATLI
jgi:hypothetical protein